MRYLYALCLALVASCVTPSTYPSTSAPGDPLRNIETLAWMAGSWASEGDGWRWEEHWSRPAGGTMIGMSRMVRADTTMFDEMVRIEERDGRIVYIVKPSKLPTAEFMLVEHGAWQALFSNPANAVPHTIGYRLQPDGVLLAWTISRRGGVDEKEFFPKEVSTLR